MIYITDIIRYAEGCTVTGNISYEELVAIAAQCETVTLFKEDHKDLEAHPGNWDPKVDDEVYLIVKSTVVACDGCPCY